VSEPLLLPAKDAFRLIGVARDFGYQLIRDGRLRVIRAGNRFLVPVSECAAFVERELEESKPHD
jgi:excisionase family DNA binding protein